MEARHYRTLPQRYHGRAGADRPCQPKRRRFNILVPALVVAAVAGAGSVLALSVETADWLAASQWLRVRGLEVNGTTRLTVAQVRSLVGSFDNEPLLDVAPERLAARLATHPRIRQAYVRRGWDRRLHIDIDERRPCALILASILVEVDDEGVVLPPSGGPLPDLPVLTGCVDRPLRPGERLSGATLERTLAFLAELERSNPALATRLAEVNLAAKPVLELRLTGGDWLVRTHLSALTPSKLSGLRSVIAHLESQGVESAVIDLRYEGQLVVQRGAEPLLADGGGL